jgi:hypothetical protein
METRILRVRGQKVMLDADLAILYGVPTESLVQAVKRNPARFPRDFTFQLTDQEFANLGSQIVTASSGLPHAFSEQGVAMLSSVLAGPRAVAVSIAIMRTFVRVHETMATSVVLTRKLDELEKRVARHDDNVVSIVRAIRELATPGEAKPKRRIGFITE